MRWSFSSTTFLNIKTFEKSHHHVLHDVFGTYVPGVRHPARMWDLIGQGPYRVALVFLYFCSLPSSFLLGLLLVVVGLRVLVEFGLIAS